MVYAVISLRRGPIFSADSARYSHWADLLIASNFNYISWSSGTDWVVPPLAYAGFVTIVALNKLILGSAWANGIVVLNLALAIATVYMVLRLVERARNKEQRSIAADLFRLWAESEGVLLNDR